MNTAATAIISHTYGHTGHIPTVCVAVVVAICATSATFVAVVADVATALKWDFAQGNSHSKPDGIHIEILGRPSRQRGKLALGPDPTKLAVEAEDKP
jgi:hypothetical protein